MYILEINPTKNLTNFDTDLIECLKKWYNLDEIITKETDINHIKKAGLPDGVYLIKDKVYNLIKLVDKTARGWIYNTYDADVELLSEFIILDTSNIKPDRCLYGDLRHYKPCGKPLEDGNCPDHPDKNILLICKGKYITYVTRQLADYMQRITLESDKDKKVELAHKLFTFVVDNKYFVRIQPMFHCGVLKKMDQYETEFKMDVSEYRKALTVDL